MNTFRHFQTAALAGLCLLTSGCLHLSEEEMASVSLAAAGPVAIERKSDPDPQRFAPAIARFADARADPADTRPVVLLIGSSSFRLWPAQEALPEFTVYNFGFGGSHFPDVSAWWHGLAPPEQPDLVLLYEGDNDTASGANAFQVYEDFLEVMGRVLATWPEATVVIVPVKPSPARVAVWQEALKVNAAMARFADEKDNVEIVAGLPAALLGGDGAPVPGYYVEDGIHLSATGYAVWNAHIRKALGVE